MHLSEAIRLGAISCKWGRFALYDQGTDTHCSMGMALEAEGINFKSRLDSDGFSAVTVEAYRMARAKWPYASTPLGGPEREIADDIVEYIKFANDAGLMTPPEIADWVEEQEYRLGIRTKEKTMEIIAQETSIDKSQWKAGEWQTEPDKLHWIDQGTDMDCLIVRNGSGALCGYVAVTAGHPLFKKDYNEAYNWDNGEGVDISVHGGLTFSDVCHEGGNICHVPVAGRPHDVWWFGFDCAHSGDLCPGRESFFSWYEEETYRNVAYVQRECASLARQLKDAEVGVKVS